MMFLVATTGFEATISRLANTYLGILDAKVSTAYNLYLRNHLGFLKNSHCALDYWLFNWGAHPTRRPWQFVKEARGHGSSIIF